MNASRFALASFLVAVGLLSAWNLSRATAADTSPGNPWVVFEGKEGPGHGKHIVFVTGDDEYHSEEGMPLVAQILAERHGFKCTVLFAIDKTTGEISPGTKDNIPGLENLSSADLMVVFTRFRTLPDEQMKHIVEYLDSGRPVLGLRTATHGFSLVKDSAYAKYGREYKGPEYDGGFGRQVLGETWINHHGKHGGQSTRGLIAPGAESHPILRGIKSGDIWGTTDVYTVRLPLPEGCVPLVMGEVLAGMSPTDPPALPMEDPKTKQIVDKNNPMMPVAWVKTYTGAQGKPARVFTTTMGGAMSGSHDWDNAGLRRLLVNAAYWCVGLEDKIPAESNVDLVSQTNPFKRGVKPQDLQHR
jgi:hypothetical protein